MAAKPPIRAKQFIEDLDGLRSDLGRSSGRVRGTLRVNCPASFGETWFTPVLSQMAERNPEITVDLVLTDRSLDHVEERTDFAIRFGPLPDVSLVARRIGASPQGCSATPGYLAANREPQSPRDLGVSHSLVADRDLRSGRNVPSMHARSMAPR